MIFFVLFFSFAVFLWALADVYFLSCRDVVFICFVAVEGFLWFVIFPPLGGFLTFITGCLVAKVFHHAERCEQMDLDKERGFYL